MRTADLFVAVKPEGVTDLLGDVRVKGAQAARARVVGCKLIWAEVCAISPPSPNSYFSRGNTR